jgi:hypothetical protein
MTPSQELLLKVEEAIEETSGSVRIFLQFARSDIRRAIEVEIEEANESEG